MPEVVIDLIDRPNEVPWGVGEPTTSVVPSAIANAVFDATGARLRSIPFRPAQVLAALNLAKAGIAGGIAMPTSDDGVEDHVSAAFRRENVAFHGRPRRSHGDRSEGAPRRALAVAGLSVAVLLAIWIAFYFFVFLPRGAIG